MSTLRTFNLQNPDSGTVNIEMDQGGNTLMTGIATVRGAAHFTSTSGSDAVGIGTDITAYKLDVRVTGAEAGLRVYNPDTSSNASGILRLGNDDNQNAAFLRLNSSNNTSAVGGAGSLVLGHGLSKNLHLSTAGVSRFAVRSDGKISAGTLLDTNNSYEFSIRGADGTGCLYAHGRNHYLSTRSTSHSSLTLKKSNSDSDGVDYLQLRDSSNAAKLIVNGDGTLQILDSIKHMGDTNTAIRFPAADTITAETGGSERLRINSSGQVSLGDEPSSGAGLLNVKPSSGDEYLKIRDAGDFDPTLNGIALDMRNSANTASKDLIVRSLNLVLWQNTSERLRITSAGLFGIGHDSPTVYGRMTVAMPSQSGGAAIQVANSSLGSGDGTTSNIVLRSVNNNGSHWADAEYRASQHIFAIQGTERMRINADGYVTKPNQPRFFARRSAHYTGYDGRNVGGTWIPFDVLDYNVGGGFQTSGSDQGRFVAPVSGLYLFHASTYKGTGNADWSQSWFDVDGSRANGTDWVVDSSRFAQNAIQVYMTAGQKIGFHPYNNQTNNEIRSTANHTWFKGCLLG